MFFQVDFRLWFQEIFDLSDRGVIVLVRLPLDFLNCFQFIKEAGALILFLWLDRSGGLWGRDLWLHRQIIFDKL